MIPLLLQTIERFRPGGIRQGLELIERPLEFVGIAIPERCCDQDGALFLGPRRI
jgi:hypothetical protein